MERSKDENVTVKELRITLWFFTGNNGAQFTGKGRKR